MGRLGLDNHQCQLFHKSYSELYFTFHSLILYYFISNIFSVMMYEFPLSLHSISSLRQVVAPELEKV